LVPAALVTGGARRLGRAMALALAGAGHDVAVHYRSSRTEAEAVCAEIRALGRRAVALEADLLDEAQAAALVPRAAAALDRPLGVLVNNASIFEYDNIRSMSRSSWDRAMESNLRAPVLLTQIMAASCPEPEIDAGGEPVARGLVVNMLDQRVNKLTPEFMSYTIAKMGLWTFTRTAAQALAPRLRVNGIGPGPTLRGGRQSEGHFRAQRAATILGRGSDIGDITGALLYFVGARSVTGQILCTDGGQHLAWQTPDVIGVE